MLVGEGLRKSKTALAHRPRVVLGAGGGKGSAQETLSLGSCNTCVRDLSRIVLPVLKLWDPSKPVSLACKPFRAVWPVESAQLYGLLEEPSLENSF